jgi:hypothetical protein
LDTTELESRLDHAFSKRIRVVAENTKGHFSSTWMFWGNKNDFYLGSRIISGNIKVSLHENGIGYVGFDKKYFLEKQKQGIGLSGKTLLQWNLPIPKELGAVHAASVLLPADYCLRSEPLSHSERRQTLILGVEDGCTAEVGVFLSRELHTTLEAKFLPLWRPLFVVTLDNGLRVSIVARSKDFDASVLPKDEQMKLSKCTLLNQDAISTGDNLNAMLWNNPGYGGTLQVIDVGGVRWKNQAPQIR